MSEKTSCSHPPGFGGSGSLSHVHIDYPPLRCQVPGADKLYYDDGTKQLIASTSGRVFSWKVTPFNPHVAPTSEAIGVGPVLSIRYSLDSKFLAIQRSAHEVQILNREAGDIHIQKCRPESESILGMFWTDCPTCDIVFVKTSGLDLFSYNFESKSLHLVESKRLTVSWYVYTHESRLVLLASGMQCKTFKGYQFSSMGIIRLPRFEMIMAKSESNNVPILAAEDVHVITVYGRIYCMQVDRVAMLLHLYRFYRDAVIPQGSFPFYSKRVAVNVVDNVLLVHQMDAKVVIIYDLFMGSHAPVSSPLPLLMRGSLKSTDATSQSMCQNSQASEAKGLSDADTIMYGDAWTFLVPDLICDTRNGLLWKIYLDLDAISASSSEVQLVLEFLQRRKLEAGKAKQLCLSITRTIILERRPVPVVARAVDALVTSFTSLLKTGNHQKGSKAEKASHSGDSNTTEAVDKNTKTAKDETTSFMQQKSAHRPFPGSGSDDHDSYGTQQSEFQDLESSTSVRPQVNSSVVRPQNVGTSSTPLNANVPEQQISHETSAAISLDDLYSLVLSSVEEEMTGDASYLVAIIIEILRSANSEKLKVPPNIYCLMIQLLARNERYAEVGLFIMNKIIEPSKEVAMQLLESGRRNFQTRKLGLDMLRELQLHHDYVLQHVQDGYYLEALRYARKKKVNTVRPSLFLEAAHASNNSQHLAAVLRFFSDFIPSFKSSADHQGYTRLLANMSAPIARHHGGRLLT
ncbi:unnamed protein product [Cuscuta campestris]|uniref:Uncharacterized protein n=1 Tax=Cuscuta campestris TaxID=132261 RepID=A0A484LCN1_9ASTE|nr:unnamed protein product [Cuscuta campestris]